MRSPILLKSVLALTVLLLFSTSIATAKPRRTITGKVYFTNNTPDDVDSFPIELFTRDRKKRVAVATIGDFKMSDIKPGRYLLKFMWPDKCVLWYRIDLTHQSREGIRVIMDAACAHRQDGVRDLEPNQ